nr:MAG TPA: hypothetical protein [Caudoviricetes sp.]
MKWVIKTKDKIKEVALSSFVSIFYNLSDLLDKNEAIKNLGLLNKFVSIEELKKTKLFANTIKSNNNHHWTSEEDKNKYNNKLDKAVITEQHLNDGDDRPFYYHSGENRFYLKHNNKYRLFGGNTIIYKTGIGTFAGNSNEVRIPHGVHNQRNIGVAPEYVSIKPLYKNNGRVGEVWVKKDANFIYVGNTGSANIQFQYIIFAPKNLG